MNLLVFSAAIQLGFEDRNPRVRVADDEINSHHAHFVKTELDNSNYRYIEYLVPALEIA